VYGYVQSIMPTLPNFTGQKIGDHYDDTSITKRQFFRHISAFSLPQVLARDLTTDPIVVREYYPYTDQLILAYVWIPPGRRMGQREWQPTDCLHMKPTFEEYRVLQEKKVCSMSSLTPMFSSIKRMILFPPFVL
jgi:hypothetical protein